MAPFSAMLAGLIPYIVIAYDEKDGFDKYCQIMPVTKKQKVMSDYIIGICAVVIMVIINCAGLLFAGFSTSKYSAVIAVMIFLGLVFPTITLPVFYRFGVVKGKVIGMCLAGSVGMITAFVTNGIMDERGYMHSVINPYQINAMVYLIIIAVAIVLYIASYFISIAVYNKKEI